jgi:homoserine dehydrogenase
VVADLVDITRLHTADPDHRVPHLAFQPGARWHDTPILPIDEVVTAFYLRLRVADEKGVLARITGILAEQRHLDRRRAAARERRRRERRPTSSS